MQEVVCQQECWKSGGKEKENLYVLKDIFAQCCFDM